MTKHVHHTVQISTHARNNRSESFDSEFALGLNAIH